jgi:hypothetical protein
MSTHTEDVVDRAYAIHSPPDVHAGNEVDAGDATFPRAAYMILEEFVPPHVIGDLKTRGDALDWDSLEVLKTTQPDGHRRLFHNGLIGQRAALKRQRARLHSSEKLAKAVQQAEGASAVRHFFAQKAVYTNLSTTAQVGTPAKA